MTNTDPAVSGLLNKLSELRARKAEANERLSALKGEVREIDSDIQKCLELLKSVADVLGVSLPELPSDEGVVAPTAEQNISIEALKAQIEEMFKERGQLRLRDIREQLGRGGNDKAVRTALYQLGEDGVIRNDNWDWFYIPPAERTKPAPSKNPE